MSAIYTAKAHAVGGRNGHAESSDGKLKVDLAMPKELGGDGNGTNPEQLFAAGYAACFLSAFGVVARQEKVALGEHSLDSEVALYKSEQGFKLGVVLRLNVPALEKDVAQRLLEKAHAICPYSIATRGNIEVDVALI